jgi:hypothetical protein
MGAESGRATVKSALKPDHCADSQGACHSTDDDKIVVVHAGNPFFTGSPANSRLDSII